MYHRIQKNQAELQLDPPKKNGGFQLLRRGYTVIVVVCLYVAIITFERGESTKNGGKYGQLKSYTWTTLKNLKEYVTNFDVLDSNACLFGS